MKQFFVYTGLRVGLFVACYAAFWGIATLFDAGEDAWVWILIGAAVVSSVLSLKFLGAQREAFAQHVQGRAERATAKFEEMKSKEDVD